MLYSAIPIIWSLTVKYITRFLVKEELTSYRDVKLFISISHPVRHGPRVMFVDADQANDRKCSSLRLMAFFDKKFS